MKKLGVIAVATGQASYPTPLGRFQIVVKAKDPTWYPPVQDAWAKGLKPVPPGPNNPLGTRWMGLSSPGIGIHGTDNPLLNDGDINWTTGCISVENRDISDLRRILPVGTVVIIQP